MFTLPFMVTTYKRVHHACQEGHEKKDPMDATGGAVLGSLAVTTAGWVDGPFRFFGSVVRSYDARDSSFPWLWFHCGCCVGDEQDHDRTVAVTICSRHRRTFALDSLRAWPTV